MSVLWAAVYGAFGLACALSGIPLFQDGSIQGDATLDWAVVAVGALAALVCGAASPVTASR
ncbi:hypothetical protein [Streptomyces sp. NPDC001020]